MTIAINLSPGDSGETLCHGTFENADGVTLAEALAKTVNPCNISSSLRQRLKQQSPDMLAQIEQWEAEY